MNHGTFAGRIGRDAETRQTTNDKVTSFSLAVDTGFGDRKSTLWVDCSLWGDRGAKLAQYLTKGKQITVAGDIDLRTYEKKDGGTGAALTCNVQRLTLQGGNDRQGEGPTPAQRAQVERSRPTPAATTSEGFTEDFDDPF